MSRTYRRKNEEHDNHMLYEWCSKYYNRIYYAKEDKEYKVGMAKFHSDSLMTMNQVPKWYKVHYCRRPFRRKEKRALFLAVKYTEEDITFPGVVKDAMYYW